jgi:hypothetical protein
MLLSSSRPTLSNLSRLLTSFTLADHLIGESKWRSPRASSFARAEKASLLMFEQGVISRDVHHGVLHQFQLWRHFTADRAP